MNATPEGAPTAALSASSMSGPTASADCAVAANRVSGATNGTWSISCSDPCPQRSCRRPPAEHHQRRLVLLCGRHRAHPVGDARARGERGDAGHPGDLRPAFGGECGGLLVTGIDQPDVLGAAAVVDGEQMPAGEREDGVDAAGAQSSGNQMSGVDRNWSLDAHGRSIIAAMGDAPETQTLSHLAIRLARCGTGRRCCRLASSRGSHSPASFWPSRGRCSSTSRPRRSTRAST